MYLLYCNAEGAVIAVHEEEIHPVPMDAYPNAVRIIPYNEPLSNLERFGEAPPLPAGGGGPRPVITDPRPYKQPEPTPEILRMYAGQVRFNRSMDGFQFIAASGPIPVWTDGTSYALLSGLAQYAANLAPTMNLSFTQGGIAYPIKASEAKLIFQAFNERIQQGRACETACLNDLASATPTITTYEGVDQMFALVINGYKPPEYIEEPDAPIVEMAKAKAVTHRPRLDTTKMVVVKLPTRAKT